MIDDQRSKFKVLSLKLFVWTTMLLLACSMVLAHGSLEESQTVIVVVGASGAPEYDALFSEWADQWFLACQEGQARYYAIGRDQSHDGNDLDVLKQALHELGQEPGMSPVWLVLIGHGTYDGRQAKFNLRGPDLEASTLAQWLGQIQRPVAVINTASASAPFLIECSDPNRVVIAATQSGYEQNFARLGGHLARSVVDPNADLDKDGQTSLLEAYLTAASQAAAFYQSQGRLLTEHALLDDNGDGLGTPADWFRGVRPVQRAADSATLDGYRAHQFCLHPSDQEQQLSPEQRQQRDRLELQVKQLRDSRSQFAESEYYQRLEVLLLQIAEIYGPE